MFVGVLGFFAMAVATSYARNPAASGCSKVVIEGEVSAGQEWKTPVGEGWVFRIVPIQLGKAGYSGWDLVFDRAEPAGFPDALLLATLPYNSINEREIGTTFGLRAQDAIGWNPRSFRFLTDPGALKEAQQLYRILEAQRQFSHHVGSDPATGHATERLLELAKQAAAGEFYIRNAHLTPGVADPAPYAQNWALAAERTAHEIDPSAQGKSTPRGSLNWVRFSLVLYLPGKWTTSPGLGSVPAGCVQ